MLSKQLRLLTSSLIIPALFISFGCDIAISQEIQFNENYYNEQGLSSFNEDFYNLPPIGNKNPFC
ncbi:MAG: hypothetical protein U9R20_06300 [Thermodesulfobacteriota bacterium]|nr:hypothetical protein [Thermodesulfobacteriota bacterium]